VLARQSQSEQAPVGGASVPASELEESSSTSYPKVPGPPRMPTGARVPAGPTVEPPPGDLRSSGNVRAASLVDASQPDIVPPVFEASPETTARRNAFAMLVQRVSTAFDPQALEGELADNLRTAVEQQASEHAHALAAEGAWPSGTEPERMARDAAAELCGIGPLEALLADASVSEIALPHYDALTVSRGGAATPVEHGFSSELSLRRVLRRLCARAGAPLTDGETRVERRLPGGARLRAVLGSAAQTGALLVIEKPRKVAVTLEDLVRSGTISRAMATFLQACIVARTNLLVVGPRDGGTASVVAALASVGGESRVLALQELEDVAAPGMLARVSMPDDLGEVAHVMQVAARVPEARLVVDASRREVAAALLDAASEGATGIVATVHAQSVRRALGRLVADVVSAHPGMSVSAARELVASCFDVAIEVSRLRDARWRVLKIAEVSGVQGEDVQLADVFTFNVERTAAGGSVEGTFNASGSVPRIAEELGARGFPLDGSLFTRPPSR
jgi:pilus assembly protein CpaF